MVFPNGRLAFGALALALLLPLAAAAQCQHQNRAQPAGGPPGMSAGQMGSGPTASLSTMCQMGTSRISTSQMSLMQMTTIPTAPTQDASWLLALQLRLMTLQQLQLQQQALATRPRGASLIPQDPAPPALLTGQPPPAVPQQKQYGSLLRDMTALQQRLDALAQAGKPSPQQASDAQHEVNDMQGRVNALSRAPASVLDRMNALREQADDLLRQTSAKPADLLAAVRASR